MKKFLIKGYRDTYLDSMVRNSIAYQIQALRRKSGLSQSDFARKIGKPQSTVSRLENEEYGKVTVTSLLEIAKATDVGLLVRFVDYPEVMDAAGRMSETELQPDTIFESVEAAKSQSAHWPNYFTSILNQGQKQQPQITTSRKSSDAIWSRFREGARDQRATRNYLDNAYATK